MDVVVVGSCMIDLISYAPRLPRSGETLHGTRFSVGFGGKGANQCVAAKKLGCSALLVAKVGTDSFGQDYINSLTELGICTEHTKKVEGSSGMAQIIVADSGENQIVIVPGANGHLSADDVENAKADIENCKVMITQLEVPIEATLAALRLKNSSSGVSIFNAAPALHSSLPGELFTLPTIFCVNETETEELTGHPLKTLEDAKKAAVILLNRGCNHVIITLGGDGAVYSSPNQDPLHIPSIQVPVVDTTGAGDAFIGALAFYLSQKKEMGYVEAIRRSCLVAAHSVKLPGTQTSFPRAEDLSKDLF